MKKTLLTLLSVLFCAITFAQSVPQGINYQAVARDSAGAELANDTLIVQFSILEGTAISWQETHVVNTNDFGLFTAIIGQGTSTSAGSSVTFDVVDWGAAAHSLKVEINYGNGYLDMGTTDFMSVPYSLHAKTAANGSTTDELQNLSISGDTLFISNSNYIILPTPTLLGCMDSTAANYDPNANTDDGSCMPIIMGCMNEFALNYDSAATVDDGSCIAIVNGCMDSIAYNYNSSANVDDGSCIYLGCTDSTAFNYNASANIDDGSCCFVSGCTDSLAFNYNSAACYDDGSCIIYGCTDSTAFNYNASANTDDGSCIGIGDTYQGGIIFYLDGNGGGLIAAPSDQGNAEWGCFGTNISGADGTAIGTGSQNTIDIVNANCSPNTSGNSIAANICDTLTLGGYSDWFLPSKDELNQMYLNIGQGNALGLGNIGGLYGLYWSSTESDSSFAWYQDFFIGPSLNWSKFLTPTVRAVRAFGSMKVYGCTDSTACNYDSLATIDDGSCGTTTTISNRLSGIYGFVMFGGTWTLTDDQGTVLASDADGDDVTLCLVDGCYTITGNFGSGASYPWTYSLNGGAYVTPGGAGNAGGIDSISIGGACVAGCTDPLATNYNSSAVIDDGSCMVIGNTFQGGIIFYLDGNGGGLIAAPSDQGYAEWGCFGTNISGADGTAIGTGAQNTIDIVNANCSPYMSGNSIAANICDTLTLGGYSDWFLPSKDELNEMNSNIGQVNGNHWSSTESDSNIAWSQFPAIPALATNKIMNFTVRAVRAFGSMTVYGCTDSTAFNYNTLANTDDGSCIAVVNGCLDPTATNYNPNANRDCMGVGVTNFFCCTYPPFPGIIGSTYQGGIVFYLNGNGGGLIAAPYDQGNAEWGCSGTVIGVTGTAIGKGIQNTIDIETWCTTGGTAADICDTLTLGGYSDWFLPSKDELNQMYLNIGQGSLLNNSGGFANDSYWSSTEYDSIDAWYHNFSNGNQNPIIKSSNLNIRAIRAFGSMLVLGCTDPTTINYNASANIDDGSCCFVSGCTDSLAFNYNSAACYDDGSCIIYGCTDSTAFNYNASANIDDGSCIAAVYGCTDSFAINYDPLSNTDDGSCIGVGTTYQGGIIFYLDGNGGGLIAAPSDQGNAEWGCYGIFIGGADGTAIGTGAQNTIDIVNSNFCHASGSSIAANICDTLTLGGYSDWFLPSKDELNKMYWHIGQGSQLGNIGGFANVDYWTSSEEGFNNAWCQSFNYGYQFGNNKNNFSVSVRAVRAF